MRPCLIRKTLTVSAAFLCALALWGSLPRRASAEDSAEASPSASNGLAVDDDRALLDRFLCAPPCTVELSDTNFNFWSSLFNRDLVEFASLTDPAVASELSNLQPRSFTHEKHIKSLRANRKAVTSMERTRSLTTEIEFTVPIMASALEYHRGEFRIRLSDMYHRNRPEHNIITSSSIMHNFRAPGVSAGAWRRVKCNRAGVDGRTSGCEVVLTGMPAELRNRMEKDFGTAITASFVFRGFGPTANAPYWSTGGFSRGAWCTPKMQIRFADADGMTLWTAE